MTKVVLSLVSIIGADLEVYTRGDDVQTWQRNLLILWFGSLIVSASYSMVIPFLPLFLLQIGVHHYVETWSGLLYSVAFLGGAVAAPYWGSLADRYGRKPMIVRAGLALFATYTLTAFVHDPYELLVLRLTQGLLSGYIPASIALIGTNTPDDQVGFALSTLSAATAAGGIAGPLLGGTIARFFGNRVAFASAGGLVLIATVLAALWVSEEAFVASRTRSSILGTFRASAHNRLLLVALSFNMLTSFSIMTIEPVLTLYIAQLTRSTTNASFVTGVVFSLTGIASVVFAPVWGRTADRIGFRRVLLFGLLGGSAWTFLQLPFHNVYAFSAVRFMYGAFFCAVYPAINGLIVRSTDSSFRGRAFGLNQTANQLGNMLGPLVGGLVASTTSIHGLFWVTGTLLLVVGIFALRATRLTDQQAETSGRST